MATRGSYQPASPDERYDPFDPPIDPIEMQSFIENSPKRKTSREQQRSGALGISLGEVPSQESTATPNRNSESIYSPLPSQGDIHRGTSKASLASSSTIIKPGLTPSKTVNPDVQALVERRAGEIAEWKIHWYTPASIIVLFVAGFIGAVGHHIFYKHLNGQPADEQLRMIRYGTALAFFVKACLVGSLVLCYRQRIWHTFRKKPLTMNAIDGLFSATEDPTSFTIWEMIKNAKLATLMALCSWLIPIASVLSPSALTSQPKSWQITTQCQHVPTLDFGKEALYNFRNESIYPGSSLVYYNTTDIAAKEPDWFDYYDQPSKIAKRLSITSIYLKKPVVYANASLQSCGQTGNCTYSISFQGPGYKCEEVWNSSNPNLEPEGYPFKPKALVPYGSSLYKAVVDIGDYARPQVPTGDQGMPLLKDKSNQLGVFQAEPEIWVGYSIDTNKPSQTSSPGGNQYKTIHEPKIFKCALHHTDYTFFMNHTSGQQIATREKRVFGDPVVNTTILRSNPNNASDFNAGPPEKMVAPWTDAGAYKRAAAYHAMGGLMRNFLRGEITYDKPPPITKSDISETRLIDESTAYPVPDLMEQVQSVFEEMLITLLSNPHLIVAANTSVPCTLHPTANLFQYYPEGLWIGYAVAIATTGCFILVGFWSIYTNGVASDIKFSRIMVTTRNPTLDRLSVGACLGGDPFPVELSRARLRFGVLIEDNEAGDTWGARVATPSMFSRDGEHGSGRNMKEQVLGKVEHCAFGVVGETKEIVKLGTYAGLKEYRDSKAEVNEKTRLLEDEDE